MTSSHLLCSLTQSIERNCTANLLLSEQLSSNALDTIILEFFILPLLPKRCQSRLEHPFPGG